MGNFFSIFYDYDEVEDRSLSLRIEINTQITRTQIYLDRLRREHAREPGNSALPLMIADQEILLRRLHESRRNNEMVLMQTRVNRLRIEEAETVSDAKALAVEVPVVEKLQLPTEHHAEHAELVQMELERVANDIAPPVPTAPLPSQSKEELHT